MTILHKEIHLNSTKQFQFFPITKQITQILRDSGVQNGIAAIFSPHTTAALRLNDNESLLQQDIMKMLYRLAPNDISYGHDNFESRAKVDPGERSNGHAHVKSFLLGSSETIPIQNGRLELGDHQEIFFIEMDGARARKVLITIMGE